MYFDCYNGIWFIEGFPVGTKVISPISTTLDGVLFSQSQLKSLDDVKAKMALVAKKIGANAIVDFKYCQKSSFWRSLLSIDDIRWEASGKIAIVDLTNLH